MKCLRSLMLLITKILDVVCGIGMFALFVMICVAVVLRYVFNSSIFGLSEVQNYLFVYLTSLGAVAAMRDNEHVGVDFFEKASPKVRAFFQFFRNICMLVIQVVLVFYTTKWIGKVGGYLTPLLRFEQRWAQLAIPVGMSLGAVICLILAILAFDRKSSTPDLSQS